MCISPDSICWHEVAILASELVLDAIRLRNFKRHTRLKCDHALLLSAMKKRVCHFLQSCLDGSEYR